MGVPGAKSFHVPFPGYGAFNPYFGRLAQVLVQHLCVADALAQATYFFTLSEIGGGNDV